MIDSRKPKVWSLLLSVVVTATLSLLGAAGAASAADMPTTGAFVSQGCLAAIEDTSSAVAAASDEARRLCTASTSFSEGPTTTATVTEVASSLVGLSLPDTERLSLVEAAKAGTIHTATFNHSYWGGSIREVHTGRFYWDGSRAWMATYRGKTGYHQCHAAGSIGVGQVSTMKSCNKPKAGTSATAAEVFDVDVVFKGSPVKYTVGLYYKKAANGGVSTWQVGG